MAEVTLATLAAQMAALLQRIDAVERKLDDATGGGKVTLAFIARQQEKILREQATMRAVLRTQTAALTRLDSSVQGLVAEVRAHGQRQDVQDQLWRNHEQRIEALEERP